MVNYLHEIARVETNHEAYARSRNVAASKSVQALAKEPRGK